MTPFAVEPPICATVQEPTTAAAWARMRTAAPDCGLLELRLDAAPLQAPLDLERLLTDPPRPVLVTCRPPREGGAWAGDEAARLALLRRAAELGAAWIDIERDAVDALLAGGPLPAPTRLIVSHHPAPVPPEHLGPLLASLRHPAADVTKLALPVDDARDALTLLRLAAAEPQPTIAIGMSFAGVATRLAGLRSGAPWTYAAADPDRPAAPGQLPAAQAKALLGSPPRARTSRARLFGVLGDPVDHSRSPALMNAAFDRLGLDAIYTWLHTRDVPGLLREAERDPGLGGVSVTIPHKLTAAADPAVRNTPAVAALGALNTLVRLDDAGPHRWSGHNTDALAAEQLLRAASGRGETGETVAVLGSGGAARAVTYAAARLGLRVRVHARRPQAAADLVTAIAQACPDAAITAAGPLATLPSADAPDAADLIVNATPVGMHPETEASPIPAAAFGPTVTAYDLVYTPVETRFIRDARAQGAQVITGLEHFVAQARAQLALWFGEDAVADLSDAWLAERALA